MSLALIQDGRAPVPAPPEEWPHSGFGSESALEAMKRVARTRPAAPQNPPSDSPSAKEAGRRKSAGAKPLRQRKP